MSFFKNYPNRKDHRKPYTSQASSEAKKKKQTYKDIKRGKYKEEDNN